MKLNDILDANQRQMTIDEYLAMDGAESPQSGENVANSGAPQRHEIGTTLPGQRPISSGIGPEPHQVGVILAATGPENHNGNGFIPGQSVGHADFADFRAVYVGPGRLPGQAKVKVVAGWSGELPIEPVTVPHSKLVEV